MKKLINSLLTLTVFTAMLVGCGGDESFIGQAKKGVTSKDYQATLVAVDSILAKDPNNAEAYYYRGVAYGEIANNNPVVANRKDAYQKMRDALVSAMEVTNDEPINLVALKSEDLIRNKWSVEHNAAVQFASGDTTLAPVDNPLEIAVDHLQNAVTINPDSTLSFEVLAEVYRMKKDYKGAIGALTAVIEKKEVPAAFDFSNLASFYMLTENYESAVTVLEEAIEFYPDSVDLVQKIADSYMKTDRKDEAISALEDLIATDPSNPQYHLVIGTQIYIMASDINEEISASYDKIFDLDRSLRGLKGAEKTKVEKNISTLRSDIAAKQTESEKLTTRAISELKTVTELLPEEAPAYNTLGIVYQNKAASLFEERNATTDNNLAADLDKEAKAELTKAMKSYEKATSLAPDNTDYWTSLFRVYTSLGMNDKAEAAMKKAGM
tara:strand:- start:18245 stop:19558 length:1314 start_codon:yes stop_codon:yes gene_type:complete